jgi:hypothetical protein
MKTLLSQRICLGATMAALCCAAVASSHREAPFITTRPKVDGTDFYMFNSYEPGRSGYVTIIANYQPFEDPQGGPNYYTMDPNAVYAIHIDNDGDGLEDWTLRFRFSTDDHRLAVNAGGKQIPVPLSNIGPLSATSLAAQNVSETYTVTLVQGHGEHVREAPVTNAVTGSETFAKPFDNIGQKSIPNYAAYADSFIHTVTIPGCDKPGRIFVGQRKDPFVVNLGETFDLVNIKYPVEELAPSGVNARQLAPNSVGGYNVTSLVVEVAASCLTKNGDPVIGGWTTASVHGAVPGTWAQVSRLGMPLVNEVVIGLPDKDRFNASHPHDDAQFLDYVTNPSLPVLLQTLFGSAGVKAPNVYPRTDLVAAFLTGIKGLNQPKSVTPAEELRLNTGIAATPVAAQNNLGVLGGDLGGFPNGRRPFDDVVTIELRVAMGVLLAPFNGSAQDPDPASDASRQLHYTDGVEPVASDYLPTFPYANTPLAGSPTSAHD